VMAAWETLGSEEEPAHIQEFARIWRSADKVVYSKTLHSVSTAKTRIEGEFEPGAIRKMKASATRDLIVGGPELARRTLKASLVDECHLFLAPVAVGGGKRSLPADLRLDLELLHERRFRSGFVFLRYRITA
jgi:dihydrofolate reductase